MDNLCCCNIGEREQNFSILEEVAAIRCTLEMPPGGVNQPSDKLIVALLAELQDEQDHEMAEAVIKLSEFVSTTWQINLTNSFG